MGLVPRDLFLELVDELLERLHRHFAQLLVPAGFVLIYR